MFEPYVAPEQLKSQRSGTYTSSNPGLLNLLEPRLLPREADIIGFMNHFSRTGLTCVILQADEKQQSKEIAWKERGKGCLATWYF